MKTHYEAYFNFSQPLYAIGLQNISKTSKRKSKFHLKLQKLKSRRQKNMSKTLKMKYLFIELYFTVNQGCY